MRFCYKQIFWLKRKCVKKSKCSRFNKVSESTFEYFFRLGIQQNLQNQLKKYDTDIGERSAYLYQLNKEIDAENLKLLKWREEFYRQDIE